MKHFTTTEFDCPCCGLLPKQELMDLLDQIREDYGSPIDISSGKRCEKHNKEIGGAKRSRHGVGDAADLVRTKKLREFLEKNLEKYQICLENPKNTGTDASGWLHIDMLNRKGWRIFRP